MPTQEDVIFRRGLSSTMPQEKVPGTLLIQTDTGNMYVDDTSELRVQIKDSTKLPLTGGTLTGSLNLGTHKVINLGAPTDGTDAATKSYVDVAFQTLETELGTSLSAYLPLKGGTMQGSIVMGTYKVTSSSVPTDNDDLVNKTYADTKLPLSGGTMTGPIAMGTQKVTSSYVPVENDDLTNKVYVDQKVEGLSTGDFKSDGSVPMTGSIVMSNHKITDLATPTDLNDAATKQYVDQSVAAAGGGDFMANGSVPMTGNLQMDDHRIVGLATPVETTDAATKQYVDDKFESAGTGSGDFMADGSVPMTGNLQVNNHQITGVLDPVNNTDGANKQYVDSKLTNLSIDDGVFS